MKYIYGVCFLLIVTLTTLFAFQNSGTVNLSLLFTQITLPMSVLIVMIYFLGMFTGGVINHTVKGTDAQYDAKNR
ncbi:hypothetical protein A8P48_05675 [Yersinia pestis]|nr:hypothetical protein A8P48_05675 [Yersinia pestis]